MQQDIGAPLLSVVPLIKNFNLVSYRKQIAEAENPKEFTQQKIREFKEVAGPYPMVYSGLVDDIIEPCETRARLIATLEALLGKKEIRYPKKHSNIPL